MIVSIYLVPPLMGKSTLALDHSAGKVFSAKFDMITDFDLKMFKSFSPAIKEVDLACELIMMLDVISREKRTLVLSNDYDLIDRILERRMPFKGDVEVEMILPSVNQETIYNRAVERYSGDIPVNMVDAINRIFRGGWERFAMTQGIKITRAEFVADVI